MDALVPFLGMKPAALFHIDGQQSNDGDDHHGDEAGELAHDDGEDDEPHEGEAYGSCRKCEEPSPDAHELQWFLESLENWIARKVGFHFFGFHLRG